MNGRRRAVKFSTILRMMLSHQS